MKYLGDFRNVFSTLANHHGRDIPRDNQLDSVMAYGIS